MLYVPTTPTIESVINSTQIKLPRFQRKKTWDNKRRFELCISLFKGYPLGTIVLKDEIVDKKTEKTIRWLLDGRQRRDTFVEMQNPVTIYNWATNYLGINKSDEESDIRRKFIQTINDYLQNEIEDDEEEEDEDEIEGEMDVERLGAVEVNTSVPRIRIDGGTQQLLDLIIMVHNKTRNKDNFTDPFIFKGYYPSFYNSDKKSINSDELFKWIKSKFSFEEEIDSLTVEEIICKFDSPPETLRDTIEYNLPGIKKAIKMVKIITDQLTTATIQQIVLEPGCSMADARKIFEIINTKGVALTGAEIMSAKPSWNVEIIVDDEAVISSIKSLYKGLEIETNKYVKWDIAASFAYRLTKESDFILGSIREPNASAKRITQNMRTKELEKKMTSGFKLMSGRYIESITKDDMDLLPEKLDVGSSKDFEDEIIEVSKALVDDEPFYLLDSYHLSMCDYVGFTTGLNYLLLMIKKWNELGCSTQKNSKNHRTFISCARSLYDRFIFEYATGVWRGSSDTRMGRNLKEEYPNVFRPIPDTEWDNLIRSVYEKNEINGQRPTKVALRALLIYFTMLRKKDINASLSEPPEVDHIIPQSRFVGDDADDPFKDSLYNYALLPRDLNNAKSGNKPSALGTVRKKKICTLEDISEDVFDDIDAVASKGKLIDARKYIIKEIIDNRKDFVKTTGEWEIN